MAKPKSSRDSYGTFLRTLKELEQQGVTGQQSTQATSGSIERSRRMLVYLADHNGPQPVADLLGVSGLAFSDFYATITALQDMGLITMNGEPGREQAELTGFGQSVARME